MYFLLNFYLYYLFKKMIQKIPNFFTKPQKSYIWYIFLFSSTKTRNSLLPFLGFQVPDF